LAFFPVRTEEFSLLGAKFTNDVVAFALFHALSFYTLVLLVRGFIHSRLIAFERTHFEREVERMLDGINEQPHRLRDELRATVQEMEAAESATDAERVKESAERESLLRENLEKTLAARDEIERQTRNIDVHPEGQVWLRTQLQTQVSRARIAEHELLLHRARVQHERNRPRRSSSLRRSLEDLELKAKRRVATVAAQAPFAAFLGGYVFVGEFLFPVGFGALAAFWLLRTQQFPMLWDLTLLVSGSSSVVGPS
jgi:hypothetical protein